MRLIGVVVLTVALGLAIGAAASLSSCCERPPFIHRARTREVMEHGRGSDRVGSNRRIERQLEDPGPGSS